MENLSKKFSIPKVNDNKIYIEKLDYYIKQQYINDEVFLLELMKKVFDNKIKEYDKTILRKRNYILRLMEYVRYLKEYIKKYQKEDAIHTLLNLTRLFIFLY
ncbi:MAG: hypothetical protein G5Z43_001140 [Caldisphaeraceae archaeon]|nr:hypothetical protein [Caldisphaeraceae archaeon]